MYTCRNCGKKVKKDQQVIERSYRTFVTEWWTHDNGQDHGHGQEVGRGHDEHRWCSSEISHGMTAEPAQVCGYMKTDGDACTRTVKPVDVEAGNYACGVHMPKFIEDKERKERYEEAERLRREEEEINNFELRIYQDAYDRLNALDPEMFPAEKRPEKQRYWGRFTREFEIDIVELERWCRSYAEAHTAVPES